MHFMITNMYFKTLAIYCCFMISESLSTWQLPDNINGVIFADSILQDGGQKPSSTSPCKRLKIQRSISGRSA